MSAITQRAHRLRRFAEDGGIQPRNKESRNSWIASLTPHFGKKFNRESPTRGDANKITRKIVFNTPASNLTNASHKGYLYWRNKKKQFERCVLYHFNDMNRSSSRFLTITEELRKGKLQLHTVNRCVEKGCTV